MSDWEIVGILETDEDYETFYKTWKPPRYCECGRRIQKWRKKCDECLKPKQNRNEYMREYLREWRKKRREHGKDKGL